MEYHVYVYMNIFKKLININKKNNQVLKTKIKQPQQNVSF